MDDFGLPEILRTSLAMTVLRVKLLLSQFGTVRSLMSQMVQPPAEEVRIF